MRVFTVFFNKQVTCVLAICFMSVFLVSCQSRAEKEGEAIRKENMLLQQTLKKNLEELQQRFEGDVGIYVYHLKKDIEIDINATMLFPSSSLIKIPILATLFQKIEEGQLKYEKKMRYDANFINYGYKGDGAIERFREGSPIYLSRLMAHMIAFSDNHAALWLQKLVGGEAINQWLKHQGFKHTRINSRVLGRKEAHKTWGWGQSTPKEMADLIMRIYKQELVSKRASEEMYRFLTQSYWHHLSLSQMPPSVQVAAKVGTVSHSRSELVLVHAPSGAYVFCVMTKNQEDRSFNEDNDGFVLIRNVSKLLWQRFEPDSDWLASEKTVFHRY